MYRLFKSRIEAKVFADIVNWSDDVNTEDMDDVSSHAVSHAKGEKVDD